MALLWQSPRLAADPRLRVGRLVSEPLRSGGRRHRPAPDELEARVERVGARVELSPELLERFPHEVSEGQLQRACLARALNTEPGYLICDELTSMLDVSTQAGLLEVIAQDVHDRGTGVLLITTRCRTGGVLRTDTQHMKVLMLDAPQAMLDERWRLGLDGRDEMWDGVLHMVPPPEDPHQGLSGDFYLCVGPIAKRRGLVPRMETGLFASDGDYRVPDQLYRHPEHGSQRGAEADAEGGFVSDILGIRLRTVAGVLLISWDDGSASV